MPSRSKPLGKRRPRQGRRALWCAVGGGGLEGGWSSEAPQLGRQEGQQEAADVSVHDERREAQDAPGPWQHLGVWSTRGSQGLSALPAHTRVMRLAPPSRRPGTDPRTSAISTWPERNGGATPGLGASALGHWATLQGHDTGGDPGPTQAGLPNLTHPPSQRGLVL